MKELSLHILDILQNSIKAQASLIELTVEEDISEDKLTITVRDDGCGMSEAFLKRVRDPFTTTRTTRKAGLGIPLLEAATSQCNGSLSISSELGKGTVVSATFQHSHIDRAPLGDMAQTMKTIVSGNPDINLIYRHLKNGKSFIFDTKEIRRILDGLPMNIPEVMEWIEKAVSEGLTELGKDDFE